MRRELLIHFQLPNSNFVFAVSREFCGTSMDRYRVGTSRLQHRGLAWLAPSPSATRTLFRRQSETLVPASLSSIGFFPSIPLERAHSLYDKDLRDAGHGLVSGVQDAGDDAQRHIWRECVSDMMWVGRIWILWAMGRGPVGSVSGRRSGSRKEVPEKKREVYQWRGAVLCISWLGACVRCSDAYPLELADQPQEHVIVYPGHLCGFTPSSTRMA